MNPFKRYPSLFIIIAVLAVGYVAAIFWGIEIAKELSTNHKLLFIVHFSTSILFLFVYIKKCKSSVAYRMGKIDCWKNSIYALILYVFVTGVVIVFSVATR